MTDGLSQHLLSEHLDDMFSLRAIQIKRDTFQEFFWHPHPFYLNIFYLNILFYFKKLKGFEIWN